MRILGYITHPRLMITIFKNDDRFSVKFESGFYEQTYKFASADYLSTVEELRQLIDAPFIAAVEQQLIAMHQQKMEAINRFLPPIEDDFDEII
ncbi:MAG: hypothetical protein RLZZ292_3333 [Bacteroidota bacterium]